eukprot:m.195262 g.195262  ORF g.195262 m.195262 type:complete len:691 (+) comp18310_c0_seq11:40-2112(+)
MSSKTTRKQVNKSAVSEQPPGARVRPLASCPLRSRPTMKRRRVDKGVGEDDSMDSSTPQSSYYGSSEPPPAGQRCRATWAADIVCLVLPGSCVSEGHARKVKKRLKDAGATVKFHPTPAATHVMVGEGHLRTEERAFRLKHGIPASAVFVDVQWALRCLKHGAVLPAPYLAFQPLPQPAAACTTPPTSPKSSLSTSPTSSPSHRQFRRSNPRSPSRHKRPVYDSDTDDEQQATGDTPGGTLYCEYHCYNCGSHEHRAKTCPSPCRGFGGNTYSPFHGRKDPMHVDLQKWVCGRPHKLQLENLNSHITGPLEEALRIAELGQLGPTEIFRIRVLQDTIAKLENHPEKIRSVEQAEKVIGKTKSKTIAKIREILQTGGLKRNALFATQANQALQLFRRVWGIGAKRARQLAEHDLRTLDDLRKNRHMLNKSQQIGLDLFEDFEQRIPRAEVASIEKAIAEIAEDIAPGVYVCSCGSYRRGKETCGDADVLISHKDARYSHHTICEKVMAVLKQRQLVVHSLAAHSETKDSRQFKFMGVWKTPGNPHRRLDLIGVPWSELACAHIYFDSGGRKTSRRKGQVAYKPPKRRASTLWKGQVLNSGTIFDAIYVCSTACWQRAFNRSLRLLARRLGGSLSQHALQMDVSRDMQDQATKLTEGAQMAEYTSNEHKGNLQTGRKNNVEKLLQHPHAFVC